MKLLSEYQTELHELCKEYINLYELSPIDAMHFTDTIYEGLDFLGGVVGSVKYNRQLQKHMVMVHHMKVLVASIALARKSLMMKAIKE